MSKNEMRQAALRMRRTIPRAKVAELSLEVERRLYGLPEFVQAEVVASYVAKPEEVQTQEIIQRALKSGKKVLVPRADPESGRLLFSEINSLSQLSVGHFGIMEPDRALKIVQLGEADVVLVPIVAWDEEGRRIGYGKGYFDRELGSNEGPFSVGLALESQRVGPIPSVPTDVALDAVVTERRVLRFGRSQTA